MRGGCEESAVSTTLFTAPVTLNCNSIESKEPVPPRSNSTANHSPTLVDSRIAWVLLQKYLHPERDHIAPMPGDDPEVWRAL